MKSFLLTEKSSHLLLGNGFSIAYDSKAFSYTTLFKSFIDCHEKKEIINKLSDSLDTCDFERLIDCLDKAAIAAKCIDCRSLASFAQECEDYAKELKEGLALAVGESHIESVEKLDDIQADRVWDFFTPFKHIYTLNYDLLPYWVMMKKIDGFIQENKEFPFPDGFHSGDSSEDYVVWNALRPYNQKFYYLHGALHLFRTGSDVRKMCWNRTGIPLKEQFMEEMENDHFPLFVAEGTSEAKLEKISRSDYLSKGLRSLASVGGSLCTYGVSFSENDKHISSAISKSKITKLAVSIYGDQDSAENRDLMSRVEALALEASKTNRKSKSLDLLFYDANSVDLW